MTNRAITPTLRYHEFKAILLSIAGVNSDTVQLTQLYQLVIFLYTVYSSLIILYIFKPFTERDVKLRLWRKIDELDKNGVRKVHAMWMVRKPLITNCSMFLKLNFLHFQSHIHTPYIRSTYCSKVLQTVSAGNSFNMSRHIYLHYQTDSLQGTHGGSKLYRYFMWQANLRC